MKGIFNPLNCGNAEDHPFFWSCEGNTSEALQIVISNSISVTNDFADSMDSDELTGEDPERKIN